MEEKPGPAPAPRLKEAMRQARVEIAERTAVVVDLRNAEIARLELLNEALDPVFAEIPPDVELFDRGLVSGDPPRLWIDMIAHVVMGRDKRIYRFLQDTRYGRRVLAESGDGRDGGGRDQIRGAAAGRARAPAGRRLGADRAGRAHRRGAPPPPLARVPGLRCRTARRGRDSVRHRLVRRAPAQPMSA
jgi:hypothetical protein